MRFSFAPCFVQAVMKAVIGARVGVTSQAYYTHNGTLLSVTDKNIYLRTDNGKKVRVAIENIRYFEGFRWADGA